MPTDAITSVQSPPLRNLVVSPSDWNSTPPCTFHVPNFDAEPSGTVSTPAALQKPNVFRRRRARSSCPG